MSPAFTRCRQVLTLMRIEDAARALIEEGVQAGITAPGCAEIAAWALYARLEALSASSDPERDAAIRLLERPPVDRAKFIARGLN